MILPNQPVLSAVPVNAPDRHARILESDVPDDGEVLPEFWLPLAELIIQAFSLTGRGV